jgi:hypothetical protein
MGLLAQLSHQGPGFNDIKNTKSTHHDHIPINKVALP